MSSPDEHCDPRDPRRMRALLDDLASTIGAIETVAHEGRASGRHRGRVNLEVLRLLRKKIEEQSTALKKWEKLPYPTRICRCGHRESPAAWKAGGRACPECGAVWPERLRMVRC